MRAHWASPLIQSWVAVVALVWLLITDVAGNPERIAELRHLDLHALGGFSWLLLILPGWIALRYWGWWTTRYIVTPDEFRVEDSGPFQESKRIAFGRIQGVELKEPFAARLLGMATTRIDVGGGESVEISFLRKGQARELRSHLLDESRRERARATSASSPAATEATRAPVSTEPAGESIPEDPAGSERDLGKPAPGAPADPSTPVDPDDGQILTRLRARDLVVGALLSLQLYAMLAALLVPAAIAWWAGGETLALSGALPLLLAIGGYFANRVVKQWNHTVALTSGGVRVSRGLTTLTAQTVPAHRVQSVRIAQPLLWRPLGRWKVSVAILAHSGEDDDALDGAVLLPIATREQMGAVLEVLWPGFDVAATLAAPVEAFAHAPRRARWLMPLSWAWAGWAADAERMVVRDGALTRRHTVIPHERVIGVELSAGPLARRMRLADVRIDVAKMLGGGIVGNLDDVEARRLLDAELAWSRTARRRGGSARRAF